MGTNSSTRWKIQTPDRYENNDPPATYKGIVQNIENRANGAAQIVADTAARNAIPSGELYEEKRVYQTSDRSEWRYRAGAWRCWDSDWVSYTPTVTGLSGTYAATGRYRYVSGLVRVQYHFALATGASTGNIWVSLPVDHDATSSGWTQGFSQPHGNFWASDQSDSARPYLLSAAWGAAGFIALLSTAGGSGALVAATGSQPFAWASGDEGWGVFDYEAA